MEFTPPRGTADLVPPASAAMSRLGATAHRIAGLYGYRYVETPAFERTELFERTSGESSDVVRKEMYTFEDRKGRSLTLRPEGTAPVVRAFLDHAQELPSPFKAYYVEPMWRYGRPQAGRMREFRQFGVEVIGTADAEADVEVIALGNAYYRELGVSGRLEINSIGDGECRPAYREELLAYLEANVDRLRDEHREHFRENPLRVLDCKDEACRAVSEGAPKISDRLCEPCKAHFAQVLEGLERDAVPFVHVSTLVRGLDYYIRTAFEWVSDALPPGQATFGAGGRYDGLAELLGGPPTPGVGFALGLDRTLLLLDAGDSSSETPDADGVFIVSIGDRARYMGRRLAHDLREKGIPAQMSFAERPLKAQLRMADRSGAAFAAIIGDREVDDGSVTMRLMADGSQEPVVMDEVAAWISRPR